MKPKIPFFLPAILFAVSAGAVEPAFVAAGNADTANKLGVAVAPGTVAGLQAHQIDLKTEKMTVVDLGRAKSWDEACAACAKFDPAGRWQLPTVLDHSTIVLGGAAAAVALPKGLEGDSKKVYPAWVRTGDPQADQKHFAGKDVYGILSEGAEGPGNLDGFSLAQTLTVMRGNLSNPPAGASEKTKEIAAKAFEEFQEGVFVQALFREPAP